MRPLLYLLLLCPIVIQAKKSSTACENLYSKTVYALSHTKNALKATNFEHQMYYAERAMTMMESAKLLITNCECSDSEEKNYQAIQNLSRALNPVDWEAGRFYSKKALAEIQSLITSLDLCSSESYDSATDLEEESSKSIEQSNNNSSSENDLQEKFSQLESSLSGMLAQLDTLSENSATGSQVVSGATKNQYYEKVRALLAQKLEELD